MDAELMSWVDTTGGYAVAIHQGKIVCKNAKGKILKSLPSKVRQSNAVAEMRHVLDFVRRHEQECAQTVDAWMLRSLPVPRAVVESIWPDPAWRLPLENAVVAPLGADLDDETVGFLKGVGEEGVGVVNLDGESVWVDVEAFVIPHPVLLEDLDEFREFATELDFEQGLQQLFRETFTRPEELDGTTRTIHDFADGHFEQLNFALGRSKSLGYRVRGGYATCPVFEDARMVEARYWLGSEYPEYETYTGELLWVDANERTIALEEVGPIAYSEGVRMASAIFAGRNREEEAQS